MKLRQFVLVLFRHQRVEEPNRNSTKTAVALPLAQDVRLSYRAAVLQTPPASPHLGKGVASPPVASPRPGPSAAGPDQTRFAFWTSDREAFHPPATRPLFRQRLRPGEPSCPPWTSRPGKTSLSPWPPIDQACAAMDLHEGRAPLDRSGAFAPLPRDPPSCRLDAPSLRDCVGLPPAGFLRR